MATVIARHEIQRAHPDKPGKIQTIAPGTSFESEGDELEHLKERGAVFRSVAQARAYHRALEGIRTAESEPGTTERSTDENVDENKAAATRKAAAKAENKAATEAKAEAKAKAAAENGGEPDTSSATSTASGRKLV